MAILDESKDLFEITFDQYLQMGRLGIVPKKGVELIDGVVVRMSSQGDRHATAIRRLTQTFTERAGGRYILEPESTIRLDAKNGPDPDLTLARTNVPGGFPAGDAIALIVEVADTSLDYDVGEKRKRYASAGIGEYWVVDLMTNILHVFRRPHDGEYADLFVLPPGEIARPHAFDDVSIQVSYALGL